jgi:hypothetical protein
LAYLQVALALAYQPYIFPLVDFVQVAHFADQNGTPSEGSMFFLVGIRAAFVKVVQVLLRGAEAKLNVRVLGKHLLPCPHAGGLVFQLAVDRYMYMACFATFFHVQAYEVADEAFVQGVHDGLGYVFEFVFGAFVAVVEFL